MPIFEKLRFDVNKEVFTELFDNPDRGFGFEAKIKRDSLTEIQQDTLLFLSNCYKKRLLGSIQIKFKTEAIGEINSLERHVQKIEINKDGFIISNSY